MNCKVKHKRIPPLSGEVIGLLPTLPASFIIDWGKKSLSTENEEALIFLVWDVEQ